MREVGEHNGGANTVCARLNAEQREWLRSEIDRRRRAQVARGDEVTAADLRLFAGLAEQATRREVDRRRRRGRAS